jgi:hypothetical protein
MTQKSSQPAPLSAQLLEMIFGFALSRSIAVAAQFGVADTRTTLTFPTGLYRV